MIQTETYENFISRLCTVSKNVRDAIESQSYLLSHDPDSVTDDDILYYALDIILDDFNQLGIEFNCNRNDMFSNALHIELFITLAEITNATTLYLSMKDMDFKTIIRSILTDGGPETSTVGDLLHFVGVVNEKTRETLYSCYEYLIDKVSSSQIFDMYLDGLLKIDDSSIEFEIDNEYVTRFMRRTYSVSRLYNSLISAFNIQFRNKFDIDILYVLVEMHINFITSKDNVNQFAWLDAVTIDKVGGNTILINALITKYQYTLNTLSPLCIGYYKDKPTFNKQTICLIILLSSIVNTIYEFSHINKETSKDVYIKNILDNYKERITEATENNIFTNVLEMLDMKYVNQIMDIVRLFDFSTFFSAQENIK